MYGVAMGSPLGPVFAHIFICDFEEKWIMNNGDDPIIWFRYVDDTFTYFTIRTPLFNYFLISIADTRTTHH